MTRFCTMFALFELALLAAFAGLPSASADPGVECCTDPRHEECSGCKNGYLLGQGLLFGCQQVGGTGPGCSTYLQECNFVEGPIIRWRSGSNCSIFQEFSMGISIERVGCDQQFCD